MRLAGSATHLRKTAAAWRLLEPLYRNDHQGEIMRNRSGLTIIALTLTLLALTTGCTVGGAAAGGVIGNEATDHSAVGTVGGAVAGGVIGHELGK
jgi:osmotically inducible lipoprotein OsmB